MCLLPLLVVLLPLANGGEICDRGDPTERITFLDEVMSKLSHRYTIETGLSSFTACDPEDPNMPDSCNNFNNPSLFYGGFQLPCSEDPCPIETPSEVFPGLSLLYQPGYSDALVVFGCVPPPCAYFSIRPYLYERGLANVPGGGGGGSDDGTGERPPDPTDPDTRTVVDIPWYDSYNHLNMKSTANPGEEQFGSQFVFISTANRVVARDIAQAFIENGFSASAINVDGIPNAWAELEGPSSDIDSFRTIARIGKPCENLEDCEEYVQIPNRNILLRMMKPKINIPFLPFSEPTPRPKSTGSSETDIVGNDIMDALEEAIVAYYGEPQYTIEGTYKVFNYSECIRNGIYCWGENFDTVYVDFDGTGLIHGSTNSFVIACGANHVELGYAVYTNFGLFAESGLSAGLIDDEDKFGSANCYAPHLPESDFMYCVEVRSVGTCPTSANAPCVELINESPQVLFQARINLNPDTQTGPDPTEIIMPKIYGFVNNPNPPLSCII